MDTVADDAGEGEVFNFEVGDDEVVALEVKSFEEDRGLAGGGDIDEIAKIGEDLLAKGAGVEEGEAADDEDFDFFGGTDELVEEIFPGGPDHIEKIAYEVGIGGQGEGLILGANDGQNAIAKIGKLDLDGLLIEEVGRVKDGAGNGFAKGAHEGVVEGEHQLAFIVQLDGERLAKVGNQTVDIEEDSIGQGGGGGEFEEDGKIFGIEIARKGGNEFLVEAVVMGEGEGGAGEGEGPFFGEEDVGGGAGSVVGL